MYVVCKFNDPSNITNGITDNFDYGLEIGKKYLVLGIVITDKQIWYLVDEMGKPGYYPNQLFEVIDASLYPGFYFKLISEDDGIFPFNKQYILGYYELCFDKNHNELLLLRDTSALDIYFKRKDYLEDYYENLEDKI